MEQIKFNLFGGSAPMMCVSRDVMFSSIGREGIWKMRFTFECTPNSHVINAFIDGTNYVLHGHLYNISMYNLLFFTNRTFLFLWRRLYYYYYCYYMRNICYLKWMYTREERRALLQYIILYRFSAIHGRIKDFTEIIITI